MFYIFILIIILLFFLGNAILKKKIENFDCKNSFCTVDLKENKCTCKYQKDAVRYLFDTSEVCCENQCQKLSLEECVEKSPDKRINYYCNISGKCIKMMGTTDENHISMNHCQLDILSNQPTIPFSTYDDCMKNTHICDKYNDKNGISKGVNKENCLKDVNCAVCSNDLGEGKCIEGNATQALDIMKYPNCIPNAKNNKNKYEYGDHANGFLQPAIINKDEQI